MKYHAVVLLALVFVAAAHVSFVAGQIRPVRRPRPVQKNNSSKDKQATESPPRPTDPKILDAHKEFIENLEEIAAEYERTKEFGKAREAYEAMLRLLPKYPPAEQALNRVMQFEATKDRKAFTALANQGWQDTGVTVVKGRTVQIQAQGSWTFQVEMQLGPNGIAIPKELRDFNLGALVGRIGEAGKPFHVGENKQFIADQSGRLYLRMYDADPRDNSGKLSVLIQSTFGNP